MRKGRIYPLLIIGSLLIALLSSCQTPPMQIILGPDASELETYAAKELQRYMYQLSGANLKITNTSDIDHAHGFIIGLLDSNPYIKSLVDSGEISYSEKAPGSQGYLLKRIGEKNSRAIVIAGKDAEGCLYGVYGLLDDHYGMGFYFSGDRFPEKKASLILAEVDEINTPATYIRGFLPWTNFPQAATSYSWEDWTHIIDQMARMRMNFIHIHNYSGGANHNEMFANFEYEGHLSRVWMATARSGHGWSCPGWDPGKYRFGSADLFDDYDFGADCALHNETLSNEEVFRKAVSEFQRVIAYAHTRGVRVGLGLDINQIPKEYQVDPSTPELVKARAEQIADDYPDLDYLLCFQSEHIARDEVAREKWRGIFDTFYEEIKQKSLPTKIAVSGWGLAAKDVATLPEDVICAPIASYTAGFESGAIYGDREYWGCPWMEKDGDCSQYYYPYTIHLSNTIEAWQDRAPNMKGLYSLTWRNTDAIDPKLSYIAKAPWYTDDTYPTSEHVYREYAEENYGKEAAKALSGIINENEPWIDSQGECRPTLAFSTKAKRGRANICQLDHLSFSSDEFNTPLIEAENFDQKDGWVKPEVREDGSGWIRNINSADWVSYEQIDFGPGVTRINYRISAKFFNARFELRLDSLDGELLQECSFQRTYAWDNWQDFSAPIREISGQHSIYLIFHPAPLPEEELEKTQEQLALIDESIRTASSGMHRSRLLMLRSRIAATGDHLRLNEEFEDYQWEDLPGAMESWIGNFNSRISDISSLGTIISVQNRYVSQNYLEKEEELIQDLSPRPILNSSVRGTPQGVRMEWAYPIEDVSGFHIYRDQQKVTPSPLSSETFSWEEEVNGTHSYSVSVLDAEGNESLPSTPVQCDAGSADQTAPEIVLISPPTSVMAGQPAWIKVRLLDGREYESVEASIYYRRPGEKKWTSQAMDRRVRSVFTCEIPAPEIVSQGIEYHIKASDGKNNSRFPDEGQLSLTSYNAPSQEKPQAPRNPRVDGTWIVWESPDSAQAFWYRIYRDRKPGFRIGPSNLLTYVHKGTLAFHDNGYDLKGQQLEGSWYYRITTMNKLGFESEASEILELDAGALISAIESQQVRYVPNESFRKKAARKVN